jgi:serine/threonine-protein kinase
MSPEQAQGQSVDHRVDIYAVGCILYHMVTGDVPFRAESFMGILSKHMLEQPVAPSARNPSVDPGVESVIRRAMEKDPARRFQTMGEFVEALVPLGQGGDLSGGVSVPSGLPAAGGASAAESAVASASPARASALAKRAKGTASPHATSEVSGRSIVPLADPNPEVRRSQTEIFARDSFDHRPQVRAASGTTVLVAVGAGVLTILVIVFLMFRGSGATGLASPSAPPLPAVPVGLPAPAAEHPAAPAVTGATTAATTAAPQRGRASIKGKGGARTDDRGHPHRGSRDGNARTKTPAELKNPFAEP